MNTKKYQRGLNLWTRPDFDIASENVRTESRIFCVMK